MKNRVKKLPITIITVYLLTTVFLYAFGPNHYEPLHPFLLYTYLLTSIVLINFGFVRGTKSVLIKSMDTNIPFDDKGRIFGSSKKGFSIILIISIVILHLTLADRTGSAMYNFGVFGNFGEVYRDNYNFIINRGRSLIEWTRVFISPITLMYFPIGVLSWKSIKVWHRLATVYLIFGNAMLYLTTGVNKGFADNLIYLMSYLLLAVMYSGKTSKLAINYHKINENLRRVIKVVLVLGIIFLVIFSINISSRQGYEVVTVEASFQYVTGYLTQGYKALDYSFGQPFESTFGFGSSMYLLDASAGWFDTDFFKERTYLTKNEQVYGWNQRMRWSSIYVWIANDVSLLGALVVMYFIGRFYGKVWIESINKKSIYSVVLFALMTQLCFYIPANNQITQTAESLFGLILLLMLRMIHNSNIRFVFRGRPIREKVICPKQ